MKHGFLKPKDKKFPAMIVLGITNVCNNRCIMCPYKKISKEDRFKPEFMEEKLYKKIVDEIAKHPGTILRLTPDGEVLLHPKVVDFVKFAKDKGVKTVSFDTNALALTEKKAIGLLEAGLDLINCSIDAFKKESYQKIRQGSNYDRVMENVHRFIDLRNKGKYKTKITVSIVDQPEVKDEIEDFIKYWTPRVDKIIRRVFLGCMGLVGKEKERFEEIKRWPCKFIFTRTNIGSDGKMRFCNDDWYEQSAVGNLNFQTISEIWQSKRYQQLREHHLKGDYDKETYCKNCTEWQSAKWDYDYFYVLNKVLPKITKKNSNIQN